MRYDFDAVVDRTRTDSLKWDCQTMFVGAPADAVPLWVADMDFRCARPILDALHRRVEHGVFGYSVPGARYRDAVAGWFHRRHGWKMEPTAIHVAPGVVPAIILLLRMLSRPGEGVVIQEPVYTPFHESIEENGRTAVVNRLSLRDGKYAIDFDGLDAALAREEVRGLLFCSPHNPVGRVWTEDELKLVVEICRRRGAWIISDEIHCDLVRGGHRHLPLEKVCPEYKHAIFTCTSPSKSFNLAGLLAANITINDRKMRQAFLRESLHRSHIGMISPLAIEATIAAYTRSEDWLDQLNRYLDRNVRYVRDAMARAMPLAWMADCQATYLLWIDFGRYFSRADKLSWFMREEARVALNAGAGYGQGGETFMRLNVACPRVTLEEGIERIGGAIAALS